MHIHGRFILIVEYTCSLFSLLGSIPLYKYTTFIYLFYCCWNLNCFSLCYYEQCHYEYLCACIFMHICIILLYTYLGLKLLDHKVCISLSLVVSCFPNNSTKVQSHQQSMSVPVAPHPCQHLLLITNLCNFSCSGGYVVVFHCGFSLYFLNY